MSLYFHVTASSFSSGLTSTLDGLKSFKITSTIESPAESFSAVFAPRIAFNALENIQCYDKGNLLFAGKIDSQKTALSKDGLTVEIDARSAGALLLDNQAKPGIMVGANVETVYNQFVTPHGFTFYNPNPNPKAVVALFSVGMGMSEWDVLRDFTRRAYGFTPYMVGTQIMLERQHPTRGLYISNKPGAGLAYTSITHVRTPYSILSRVYYRARDGLYRYWMNNIYPDAKNTVRRRFFIPSTEYSNIIVDDAFAKINRSMLDYEHVIVELPGITEALLGQSAVITDDVAGRGAHMVSKIERVAGAAGVYTRLTLINPEYYDRERKELP